MLETEPQNAQPNPEQAGSAGQDSAKEGGQRRGLLRRGRRALKPVGLPAFRSGAGADSQQAADTASANQPAAAPAPAARTETPAATGPAVPVVAFQPPVVIFQPPALTGARSPAEAGRARGQSGSPADAGGDEGAADVEGADAEGADAEGAEAGAAGTGARRRRRGGRGRGKGGSAEPAAGQSGTETGQAPGSDQAAADSRVTGGEPGRPAEAAASRDAAGDKAADDKAEETGKDAESAGTGSSTRRRRRRRQRDGSAGGTAVTDVPAPDDPSDTVVHVRAARAATADTDDVRAVKGSTRLEAKRQRRRDGRDSGRRRPPIISESEFLARREAVERVMVVRQHGDRTQIAVLEDGVLVEHYVDKASHQSYVGNVYLGKVQNVLPSMEAAFVDIGKGRNAVLYAGEVNFDATGLEGVAKRIESALKSGQSIMVQVTKDPIGHKGARLTSQISLPGRYLVYVPGASMTGISRKLPDTERARLKQILKQVAPADGGIIVRTAAEGASEEELSHDVTRLVAQWQAIERKARTATAPDLLNSEPDLTIRVVRDIFNEDFTKLVIASDSEWDLVDEYVKYVAPNLADRLDRWTDDKDLFAAYRIDEQLAKALDRKVWLPSGGSLVIDTTEAMTVIDVNTGKFTGQGGNLEQTVTRNNLEAAEEIVRQLRLRDIGGIIVIDFIDMVLESNRDLVLRRLIECLARDRTKHQVAEVTSLGLVQMTRKRVGSGLLAAFSVPCEHCNGRGVIVSVDLTDPQPAGRAADHGGAQVSAMPKPGPARSRSARSRAAQAASGQAADGSATAGGTSAAGGMSAADDTSAVAVARAAAAVVSPPPPGADVPAGTASRSRAGAAAIGDLAATGVAAAGVGGDPAGSGVAAASAAGDPARAGGAAAGRRGGRGRAGGAAAGRRAGEPAGGADQVPAGVVGAGVGEDQAAPGAAAAQSSPAATGASEAAVASAAPRRRPRRAAQRQAGPPDNITAVSAAQQAPGAGSPDGNAASVGDLAGQGTALGRGAATSAHSGPGESAEPAVAAEPAG